MIDASTGRRPARVAGPELLALAKWEDFTGWLVARTAQWPKALRFTLTQRVENHALDVLEKLIVARYEPASRPALLRDANLLLERMRHLLRLARERQAMATSSFEHAAVAIDEVGRMLHGWRQAIELRPRATAVEAPCDG